MVDDRCHHKGLGLSLDSLKYSFNQKSCVMKINKMPSSTSLSFLRILFVSILLGVVTSCENNSELIGSDSYAAISTSQIVDNPLSTESSVDNLSLLCGCANNCTLTQGYWKNHGPAGCSSGNNENEWPTHVLEDGLYLGNVSYTASQLCAILNTPSGGRDKTISLQHQLIAAKLNMFKGADPTAALPQILAADQWLITGGPIGTLIADLTAFNEGLIGPGHCGTNL